MLFVVDVWLFLWAPEVCSDAFLDVSIRGGGLKSFNMQNASNISCFERFSGDIVTTATDEATMESNGWIDAVFRSIFRVYFAIKIHFRNKPGILIDFS